jgi:hypothetical protein
MTREEEIKNAFSEFAEDCGYLEPSQWTERSIGFEFGAKWADNHPDIDNKIRHARRLEQQLGIALTALEENANEDFRGNRSSSSVRSFAALEKIRKLG